MNSKLGVVLSVVAALALGGCSADQADETGSAAGAATDAPRPATAEEIMASIDEAAAELDTLAISDRKMLPDCSDGDQSRFIMKDAHLQVRKIIFITANQESASLISDSYYFNEGGTLQLVKREYTGDGGYRYEVRGYFDSTGSTPFIEKYKLSQPGESYDDAKWVFGDDLLHVELRAGFDPNNPEAAFNAPPVCRDTPAAP